MKKIFTLCIIYQHPKVLLGMKKRGFGTGRWNGFGGKVEEGESIEEGALRELKEECTLEAIEIDKVGIINCEYKDDSMEMEMHIFRINKFKGEPKESEEMRPEWFYIDEIPFSQTLSTTSFWMPMFLKGRKFKGRFLLDRPSVKNYSAKILEKKELIEVEEI